MSITSPATFAQALLQQQSSQAQKPTFTIPTWWRVAGVVAGAAGAYHGYKRNSSIGWAVLWSIFGGTLPFLAGPVMVAQGFGKKKG